MCFTGANDISKTDRLDCLETGLSKSGYFRPDSFPLALLWFARLSFLSLSLSLFFDCNLHSLHLSLLLRFSFFFLPILLASPTFPLNVYLFFLSFYISSTFIFFVCKPGIPDRRECSRSSARETECANRMREKAREKGLEGNVFEHWRFIRMRTSCNANAIARI